MSLTVGLHPRVLGHVSLDVLPYSLKVVQPKLLSVAHRAEGWALVG